MSKLKSKKEELKQSFEAKGSDYFGADMLDIPQCYRDEAKAKGLELKWVSYKALKENDGTHKYGWVGYKFESKPDHGTLDPSRFLFGKDPEGVVRKGDLILAVRPIEMGNQHRQKIATRRAASNRHYKTRKQEFKDFVKSESKGAITVDDSDEE